MRHLPETFYLDAFRQAPIGIAISDGQGFVVDANDYLLEKGGWKREELDGMMATDFYADGAASRHAILESMTNRGVITEREVRFKKKDGTPFMTAMSARPFSVDGERFIIVSVRVLE